MVVEHFKGGGPEAVGIRFREMGRMMPEGVEYVVSWMESSGGRCFQVMEARSEEALRKWTANWEDLVDFEIIPVMTSAQYWAEAP